MTGVLGFYKENVGVTWVAAQLSLSFPCRKWLVRKNKRIEYVCHRCWDKRLPGQNNPTQNIPGQNISEQNLSEQNIPEQNIPDNKTSPDKTHQTKYTAKRYREKTYMTIYTGQNMPDEI